MLRMVPALVAVASLPLLLAPGHDPCPSCEGELPTIPISVAQGEGSWHELVLQPKTRYTLRLDTLNGESTVELFSLNPKAPLVDLKCTGDTKRSQCTFGAQAHGLLGLYVEPKTRIADAMLELSREN